MLTFDDLSELKDSESARMEFVLKAIDAHKDSKMYQIATENSLLRLSRAPCGRWQFHRLLWISRKKSKHGRRSTETPALISRKVSAATPTRELVPRMGEWSLGKMLSDPR